MRDIRGLLFLMTLPPDVAWPCAVRDHLGPNFLPARLVESYSTKLFVDIYELIRIMARMHATLPRPTDAELAILRVLWERGPATVRQVHEALADARDTGYTTTLKLMQIMAEKGLVTRDESDADARLHARSSRATKRSGSSSPISSIARLAVRPRRSSCRR